MKNPSETLETKAIHAGEPVPRIGGAAVVPVFQSSTFEYQGGEDYHDIRYLRLSNSPSHLAVQDKIAALESAPAALVTASGMAAISTTLLTLVGAGEHVIAQSCLYGGTHSLLTKDLPRLGINHSLFDATRDDGSWDALVRPTTRVVYVETMTNPTLAVADLVAVVLFAKRHGLVTVIDNTFASPVNFRPFEHGFDVVVHSATKYLNGHSDIVAGAVVGTADLVRQVKTKLDHFGGSLDPHACFLLHRGLKTLVLRVRQHNATAQAVAEFLSGQPQVRAVHYPGLPAHPQHARATELFAGFGGVVSFEVAGGDAAAAAMIGRLGLAIHAPSLGGVETLVTAPGPTTHASLSPAEKAAAGLNDGLVRLSVGLEAADDLIRDLGQALR